MWLAVDALGHVAAFVTSGSGPIPRRLIEDGLCPMPGIEGRIGELPRTSVVRILASLKKPDDFVEIAERGIFAYDWSDVHRARTEAISAYELIAVPSSPIGFAQLPEDLAALAVASKLERVTFQTARRVEVERSLDCMGAE